MFTLNKLKSLPFKTRLRKLVLILQKAELELVQEKQVDTPVIISILKGLVADLPEQVQPAVTLFNAPGTDSQACIRLFNSVRHSLLDALHIEPSEWDFIIPDSGILDQEKRIVFPISVYLEDIRSPFNVGSIFRTAESFGVSRICISPHTASPEHPRALKTARGCSKVIPWQTAQLDEIAEEEAVFALELGGTPIDEFDFPEKGIVLIGSEELGLGPESLGLAGRKNGSVSIPLAGAKRSINVSVAFGILMYKWFTVLMKKQKTIA